jgi:hypothetical protein
MPQWIQCWFACDEPGCESRTEHMVRVYQTSHAEFQITRDDGGYPGGGIESGLPEGWRRTRYTDKVYCPTHVAKARRTT